MDGYTVWKWPSMWDLTEQHEPLLAFIAFPFVVHSPRQEEGAELLEEFKGLLQEPDVQEVPKGKRWDILCKYLARAGAV